MAYLDTAPLIAAEGMIWPLDTFLDSHGFERRPDICECRMRYAGPVEIVDESLHIRTELEARQIDWHSVLAVKAGSHVCEGCGFSFEPTVAPIYATEIVRNEAVRILRHECRVFTVNSFEADNCEDCQDCGDWEY